MHFLGADAFFEHLEAEGAGYAYRIGFGFEVLVGADVVDAAASALFHPHVAAARTAAESLIAAAFHLHKLQSRYGFRYLTWLVVDAVVPPKIAGVVVGEGGVNLDKGLDAPICN